MFKLHLPFILVGLTLAACSTFDPIDLDMPAQYDGLGLDNKWGFYGYLAWDNDFSLRAPKLDLQTTYSVIDTSRNLSSVIFRDGVFDDDLFLPNPQPLGLGRRTHGLQEFMEVNSGSPDAFAAFLDTAHGKAPAPRQLLVISDHGGGIVRGVASDWFGATSIRQRTRSENMPVRDVAAVLRHHPVTVTMFNACFMNMVEVAYEMKDATRFIVGSQTSTVIGDFSLADTATTLDSAAQLPDEEVAVRLAQAMFANEYHHVSVSAVATAQTVPLAETMRQFTDALSPLIATRQRAMLDAVRGAQAYANESGPALSMFNSYRDLVDVAERLGQVHPTLTEPAARVVEAARRAILWGQHKSEGEFANYPFRRVYHLSLYAAADGSVDQDYLACRWAQDTGWGRFLVKLNSAPTNGRSPVTRDPFPGAVPSLSRTR